MVVDMIAATIRVAILPHFSIVNWENIFLTFKNQTRDEQKRKLKSERDGLPLKKENSLL